MARLHAYFDADIMAYTCRFRHAAVFALPLRRFHATVVDAADATPLLRCLRFSAATARATRATFYAYFATLLPRHWLCHAVARLFARYVTMRC